MATDMSKDNLTDGERNAGFSLINDGKWVKLYNNNISSGAITQWPASTPNLKDLVRSLMRETKERRDRPIAYLPGAIQEERQAVVEYKGKASVAATLGLRGVAKFFEQVANDEERHAVGMESLNQKLRSQQR